MFVYMHTVVNIESHLIRLREVFILYFFHKSWSKSIINLCVSILTRYDWKKNKKKWSCRTVTSWNILFVGLQNYNSIPKKLHISMYKRLLWSLYSKYTEKQPIHDQECGYFAQNKLYSTNGIFFVIFKIYWETTNTW